MVASSGELGDIKFMADAKIPGNFIEGREGILIPKTSTQRLSPALLADFFISTLRANLQFYEGRDPLNTDQPRKFPPIDRFVIPASENEPLVMLEYALTTGGKQGNNRVFEVLKDRGKPGDLEKFLRIQWPKGLKSLDVSTLDGEDLSFSYQNEISGGAGWTQECDDERTPISAETEYKLGHIATNFTELVS